MINTPLITKLYCVYILLKMVSLYCVYMIKDGQSSHDQSSRDYYAQPNHRSVSCVILIAAVV